MNLNGEWVEYGVTTPSSYKSSEKCYVHVTGGKNVSLVLHRVPKKRYLLQYGFSTDFCTLDR